MKRRYKSPLPWNWLPHVGVVRKLTRGLGEQPLEDTFAIDWKGSTMVSIGYYQNANPQLTIPDPNDTLWVTGAD